MSDFQHLSAMLPDSKFELVTDTASLVAIISPWWLPLLKETSEIAALLLPIFGVTWLAVQIAFKIYNQFKRKPSR